MEGSHPSPSVCGAVILGRTTRRSWAMLLEDMWKRAKSCGWQWGGWWGDAECATVRQEDPTHAGSHCGTLGLG